MVAIIATDAASNTDTKTLTITVLDIPNTVFGTFAAINKQYFAGPYTIVPPTTYNSNPIFYTSDNTAVATISGSTITFTGIGTATITATQAADENYEGGSVSTLLTVLGKDLVAKFGGVSSTDVNYVDANGRVGGSFGVDKYGAIQYVGENIITSGLIMHLDAGNPASYSGSGTTWTDVSGNGNNGTLFNGVSYTSDNSGALVFDGVNDYGTLGNTIILNSGLTSSSFSSWWKYLGQGSGSDKRGFVLESASFHYSLLVNTDGTLGVHINTTGNSTQFIPGFSPTIGRWYYSSVVWDGINLIVYIDGVEVGRRSQSGTSLIVENLRIGTYRDNNNRWWLGNIAQVFIYNRALSTEEIKKNYDATKLRYGL